MGRARRRAAGAKHATLGPSASAPVLPVMRVDDPAASPEPTGGTSSQEQRDLEQIGHIANFAADPALMAALDLDERAVVARARGSRSRASSRARCRRAREPITAARRARASPS